MNMLQQIFKTEEFDEYVFLYSDGSEDSIDLKEEAKWENTWISENNEGYELDSLSSAKDNYDDFIEDLEYWGGWVSDKFEDNLYNPDLKQDEYWLIGTDFIIIECVSLNGELLMWSLHED